MKLQIIVIIFIGLTVANCNQKSAADESKNCEKPIMYKTSELAALMRQMYDDNDSVKAMLMRGEWPDSLPSYFSQIHTAKATDPTDKNETFKVMADSYLEKFENLKNAEPSSRKKAYSELVEGCVNCHQVFCNGPLPKIEKLRLAE